MTLNDCERNLFKCEPNKPDDPSSKIVSISLIFENLNLVVGISFHLKLIFHHFQIFYFFKNFFSNSKKYLSKNFS